MIKYEQERKKAENFYKYMHCKHAFRQRRNILFLSVSIKLVMHLQKSNISGGKKKGNNYKDKRKKEKSALIVN